MIVIVIIIVDWLRSALSNVDSKYVDDEGGDLIVIINVEFSLGGVKMGRTSMEFGTS